MCHVANIMAKRCCNYLGIRVKAASSFVFCQWLSSSSLPLNRQASGQVGYTSPLNVFKSSEHVFTILLVD